MATGHLVGWSGGVALSVALAATLACSKKVPEPPRETNGGAGGVPAAAAGGAGRIGRSDGGAGRGGSTESGEAGGVSDPSALPAFLDSSRWESVTTVSGCTTRVAKAPAETWPALHFESIGAGQSRADVIAGSRVAVGNSLGSGPRFEEGHLRLTLAVEINAAPHPQAVVTHDLEDGRAVAALVDDECLAFTGGPGSPHVYLVAPKQGTFVQKKAWLPGGAAPKLELVSGTSDVDLQGFDTGEAWGGIEALANVLVTDNPTSNQLSLLHQGQGVLHSPAGAENLGVWAESTPEGHRVVGWNPQEGMVALAGGAWAVASLGASSTKVVWTAGSGPRARDGGYDQVTLMWCDRGSTLTACEPQLGSRLPITSAPSFLATQGNLVAFGGCVEDACSVYVSDLTSEATYQIDPAPGHGIDVLGIDDQHVYIADRSPENRGSVLFDGILRYELAKLSGAATKLD